MIKVLKSGCKKYCLNSNLQNQILSFYSQHSIGLNPGRSKLHFPGQYLNVSVLERISTQQFRVLSKKS